MRLRATLGLSLSFGVLAVIGVAVAGPMVLQVFGPAYAEHAGAGLVVLALGVFPVIVRSHFVALVRIQGRVRQTVGWLAAAGILELSGAALGACLGELTGFLIGWVGAVLLEACLMARPVWRATGLQLLGRSHDWK
jgi:O-antigen/teichoic acid export membrane protein